MGSVTKLADRRPRLDPRLSITFEADGPFEALGRAREYLANREFSVGKDQAGQPIGVMFGEHEIQKWTHLSAEEQNDMHGKIEGDIRRGPITISIRPDAPRNVIDAFRSVPATVANGTPDASLMGFDAADAHEVIDPPNVFDSDHPDDIRAQAEVEHRHDVPAGNQREQG